MRRLTALSVVSLIFTIFDTNAFGQTVLLSDNFTSTTMNPNWVMGGPGSAPWTIAAGGGYVRSEDSVGGAANHITLTRSLSQAATNYWVADVDYGWLWGTGAGGARDAFSMLNSQGTGYAIYVDQKNGGDIGIEKYVLGSYAGGSYTTRPFADSGLGNVGGALTSIRLVWDSSSGLDLYLATGPGSTVLSSTPIVHWANTDLSGISFTQFQLGDISAGGYQSAFDNVLVTVPEPSAIGLVLSAGALFLRRRRQHS